MKNYTKSRLITLGTCFIVIAGIIFAVFLMLQRRDYEMKVTSWRWESTIEIEEFRSVKGAGWECPKGAYDVDTELKYREDSSGHSIKDVWYTYKYNKWVNTACCCEMGSDRSPYYGTFIPEGDGKTLGSTREAKRYIKYFVCGECSRLGEGSYCFEISADTYNDLTRGCYVTFQKAAISDKIFKVTVLN